MVIGVAVEDATVKLSIVSYSFTDFFAEFWVGWVGYVNIWSEVFLEEFGAEDVDSLADSEVAASAADGLLRALLND